MTPRVASLFLVVVLSLGVTLALVPGWPVFNRPVNAQGPTVGEFDRAIVQNAQQMLGEGRRIFRYDTFGDEAWWGDTLRLHRAIEGAKFGGVGPGVSPKTALAVGLKVDMDSLPAGLVDQIKGGKVNLDDPATTLALLKINAVVGVTGFFNPDGRLKSTASSARSAIRRWTTPSHPESATASTGGGTAISTSARSSHWLPICNQKPPSLASTLLPSRRC